MKSLNEFIINEQLILEYLVSVFNDYKISINIIKHAEDRQTRSEKNFISKSEIIYTIFKVSKDIYEDFNLNIIKIGDRIKIVDKSRNKKLNIICEISKDNKFADWITLNIITEIEKNNMKTYDISKEYITYSSDNKVKQSVNILSKTL